MTSRRRFLQASAAVAGTAPLGGQTAPNGKPNLLVLISDQQHWQACGFQDHSFDTPQLDRLARESVVFENAFCTTPQCSPSRSSIFTGFYPSRTGVWGNIGASGGRDLKMQTVGVLLQQAGYETAYFGKWHLGNDPRANAGWNTESKVSNDGETTAKAIDFLRRHAGRTKPFAMFLCYLDPHNIYQFQPDRNRVVPGSVRLPRSWKAESFRGKPPVQKEFMTADQGRLIWDKPEEVWEAYRDFYRARVQKYDNEIGQVLRVLSEGGLDHNTVVIATSDHGDMDANHRLIFKGPFLYEHMVRVPLVVHVPNVKPRRERDFHAVHVDLTPTLLDFAGAAPSRCHGISLKPLLGGTGMKPRRNVVISEYYGKQKWVNPMRMVRTPEYKYNYNVGLPEELYDLRTDPDELTNLAGDPARLRVKRNLKAYLDRWIKATDDPFYTLKREGEPGGSQA